MRYLFIILLMALSWSCTSCTESKPENDELITDSDSHGVSDPDLMDKTNNDDDVSDSSDDKTLDVNDTDLPDNDITEEEFVDDCDVKLIDAPFPYKDGESLTFCRPGCDTPTENDPQCMTNLWKEQNYNLCHEHPEYDCCGYPCVLDSLKPLTKEEEEKWGQYAIPMHKCDLKLNPENWGNDGTHGVVKSWNMSDGKVGFYIYTNNLSAKDWSVQSKYVSYDIETQKYNFILPARGQEQSYFKGKRIGLVSDKRSLELNNSNIYLAYIGDDGLKTLAYNKKVHRLAYEPALNDKWAFVNLQETENSHYKMMYAKVGEWKWTELGGGFGWEPGIVGDTLVLVDDDVNGWICDLSKSPLKIADCMKVNREGEKVRGIRINKNDETKFVYNSNIMKLVHLELKDGSFIYNDLITDFSDETKNNAYSLAALEYKDTILLFEEIVSDGSSYGGLLCYYRTDKDKKYCMKKMEDDKTFDDGTTKFPYGFAEFEGKWLLYQKKGSTPLILRDMECYCKEEGVCPFEE